MLIGVTGKSGVGKNYFIEDFVLKLYSNIFHIDIDKIGHTVTEIPEVKEKLVQAFGENLILNSDFTINRKELSELVFTCKTRYQILEDITLEPMYDIIDRTMQSGFEHYILNSVLLPKMKYWKMCNFTFLITRDEDERRKALFERDGLTLEKLQKRDCPAPNFADYKYDYWIVNK